MLSTSMMPLINEWFRFIVSSIFSPLNAGKSFEYGWKYFLGEASAWDVNRI